MGEGGTGAGDGRRQAGRRGVWQEIELKRHMIYGWTETLALES